MAWEKIEWQGSIAVINGAQMSRHRLRAYVCKEYEKGTSFYYSNSDSCMMEDTVRNRCLAVPPERMTEFESVILGGRRDYLDSRSHLNKTRIRAGLEPDPVIDYTKEIVLDGLTTLDHMAYFGDKEVPCIIFWPSSGHPKNPPFTLNDAIVRVKFSPHVWTQNEMDKASRDADEMMKELFNEDI